MFDDDKEALKQSTRKLVDQAFIIFAHDAEQRPRLRRSPEDIVATNVGSDSTDSGSITVLLGDGSTIFTEVCSSWATTHMTV
jgi:hypothetical protein